MRATLLLVGWLFSNALSPALAQTGDIEGQLTITRILTRKRVVLPVYQSRGISPQRSNTETGPIDEWARTAVYLERQDAPSGQGVTATIDQKGQRFEPEIVVVPVGSAVSFPNSDPIFHNVFSLSSSREFDLGFYPEGDSRTVTFDETGIVQVYCHLHPEMSAAILVVPNSWHTRPDDAGRFSFSGVPPGPYQLVVWHKSAGFFRRAVEVTESGRVEVSIEIPLEANEAIR